MAPEYIAKVSSEFELLHKPAVYPSRSFWLGARCHARDVVLSPNHALWVDSGGNCRASETKSSGRTKLPSNQLCSPEPVCLQSPRRAPGDSCLVHLAAVPIWARTTALR